MPRLSFLPNSQIIWTWLETLLLTALVLALSFYSNPSDPFLFQSAFPWIWFAPVLLALRYGIGAGLFSVILIMIVFVIHESSNAIEHSSFHRLYLLSGFILTLICAEFSNVWQGRLRRAELAAAYAEQRLNEIAHSYHLLASSHTHLEQSLIAKPVTLRSAVTACVELLKESKGALSPEYAQRFIELLAYYCHLERCGLYLTNGKNFSIEPIAFCGEKDFLVTDDPLVEMVLEQGQVSYHAVNCLSDDTHSNYLACVPFINSENKLLGLLVINEMPFLSLQEETLRLLMVIMGYYANQCWAVEKAKDVLQRIESCPLVFAAELTRLTALYQSFNIVSTLVALTVKPCIQQRALIQDLKKQQRGLDMIWESPVADSMILFVIMPFTDEGMIEGYRSRMRYWLKELYDLDLESGPLSLEYKVLKNDPIASILEHFMEQAHAA